MYLLFDMPVYRRVAENVVQMQSEGKKVMEDLSKQLESMHSMFEKISGGSYELKGREGAQASEVDARMHEV